MLHTGKPVEVMLAAIQALDLEPVKVRIMDPKLGEGWTREYADSIEKAYKTYLSMLAKHPEDAEDILLSKDVDEFWHTHILQTMKYHRDCETVFGKYLHHNPHVGKLTEEDLAKRNQAAEKTRKLYEAEFGGADVSTAAWTGVPIGARAAAMSAAAVRADDAAMSAAAIQAGNAAMSAAAVRAEGIRAARAAMSAAAIRADDAAMSAAAVRAGNAVIRAEHAAMSAAAIRADHAAMSAAAITADNAAMSAAAIHAENAAMSAATIRADNAAMSAAAITADNAAMSAAAIRSERPEALAAHA